MNVGGFSIVLPASASVSAGATALSTLSTDTKFFAENTALPERAPPSLCSDFDEDVWIKNGYFILRKLL